MNVPPSQRNEGRSAPFAETDGTRPWERPAGAEPPGAAPAPGVPTPSEAAAGSVGAQTDRLGDRCAVAGWGQRVAARIIDWIIVGIPAGIAGMLVGFVWIGAQTMIAGYGDNTISRNFWLIFAVCCFIAFTVYDSVFMKRWRRTVGKRAMGLEVAPLVAEGAQGPIPVTSMVARSALTSVPFLVLWNDVLEGIAWALFVVFVALWPLWSGPNRQGVHDKLAGTVVLRTR